MMLLEHTKDPNRLRSLSLLYWNEISVTLAKQGAVKDMSEMSYSNLLLSSHEIVSTLQKTVKTRKKSKSAIPSCTRYLARVIYKFRLN